MRFPLGGGGGFAGILIPPEALREPAAAHDIGVAVAVDVEGEIAEIVNVIGGEELGAEVVFGPGGGFIPVLAGDDVELAVTVHIDESGGLVLAEVEGVFGEEDFAIGARGRPGKGAEEDGGRGGREQTGFRHRL